MEVGDSLKQIKALIYIYTYIRDCPFNLIGEGEGQCFFFENKFLNSVSKFDGKEFLSLTGTEKIS